MKTPKDLAYHWAYRRESKSSLNGRIRRHMEETNVTSWDVVAEREEDDTLARKIMKFDGNVEFEGKRYHVLFLEVWYYYGDALYMVKNLYEDLDGGEIV